MLYLKEINQQDWQEEYNAIKQIPSEENGFINKYNKSSEDYFKILAIPRLIDKSKGIKLEPNQVPETYFFLWNDNKIVGLFKIRHYLNDFLREGPGHISYSILPSERKKGYATKGLSLAIKKASEIIKEDSIQMCVRKNNEPSLKVQLKNGATITKEYDFDYVTNIHLQK